MRAREGAARLSRHLQELPVRENLRSGSASARRPMCPPEIQPAGRCPSRPHRRPGAAGGSAESLPLLGPTKTCTCIRLSRTAPRILPVSRRLLLPAALRVVPAHSNSALYPVTRSYRRVTNIPDRKPKAPLVVFPPAFPASTQ